MTPNHQIVGSYMVEPGISLNKFSGLIIDYTQLREMYTHENFDK